MLGSWRLCWGHIRAMLSLRQAKNGMFLWKVLRAVVMLAGLLQQKNSSFEGVMRENLLQQGIDFPSVRFLS